jgi:hypothetical protein
MGTVPTPSTFSAGAMLAAATLNQGVRDVLNFILNPPQCQAYDTTGLTLTTGVAATVPLGAENYDEPQPGDSPMHDNTTNNSRITIRTTGKYQIDAYVCFAANATGARRVEVVKNGAASIVTNSQPATPTVSTTIQASKTVPLSAGDYIEMQAYQTSGGNLALNTSAPGPSTLTVRLISA